MTTTSLVLTVRMPRRSLISFITFILESVSKSALTPRALAKAIGVSESSVKRWVDRGDIRAIRTVGGHRRISIQEAARYVRERSIPIVRPELLGLSDLAADGETEPQPGETAERLFGYLHAGAAERVRALLVAEYFAGASVAEIVDGPLRTAMERIGEIWLARPAGIFIEHRATQIAIQVLAALRDLVSPGAGASVAVGGAPAGDVYQLPSMAVAAVLEGEGIRAVNLGANMPLQSLAAGIEDSKARLAWLSVSVAESPDTLRSEIVGLLPTLERRGARLVVGGGQATRLELPRSDLLSVAGSMAELSALVKGANAPVPTSAGGA